VAAGLETVARDEIARRVGSRAQMYETMVHGSGSTGIRFVLDGPLTEALDLRTVSAVYLVERYAVPRPRALLGDQHLRALLAQIALVRSLHPPDAFATLFVSAAGSESAVLTRLKSELSAKTGLTLGEHEGDLQIRLRPAPAPDTGWETLLRLTPRPLTARSWRVCNMEGALNAAVAHAMALLTEPDSSDVCLNIGCGSGTLLIERLSCAAAARAIGCDIDKKALDCARANVAASGYAGRIELYDWDARALPLAGGSVDVLLADLPFGQLVGSHDENRELYPALLREAARVARSGARYCLVTHEARLIESTLRAEPAWVVEQTLRVSLRGLPTRVLLLRRH
jgi:tRNA (guanine6-N2)-methyltransferase